MDEEAVFRLLDPSVINSFMFDCLD